MDFLIEDSSVTFTETYINRFQVYTDVDLSVDLLVTHFIHLGVFQHLIQTHVFFFFLFLLLLLQGKKKRRKREKQQDSTTGKHLDIFRFRNLWFCPLKKKPQNINKIKGWSEWKIKGSYLRDRLQLVFAAYAMR